MEQPNAAMHRIRQARRRDWRLLYSLFRESFPTELAGAALSRRLSVGYRDVFVAERGTVLLGFYMMTVNEHPSEAWLDYMAVTSAARGRKLGAALLDHFERTAAARGFTSVGLSVERSNAVARALYTSRGYAARRTDDRKLVMSKSLPARADGAPAGRLAPTSTAQRLVDRMLYRIRVGSPDGARGRRRRAPPVQGAPHLRR